MTRLLTLLLPALAASTACATYAKLEPEKVTAISLRLGGGGDTFCANDPRAHIVAAITYESGAVVETWNGEGSKGGKLRLGDLAITSRPASIDELGRIALPRGDLRVLDQRVAIHARLRDRPIAADLTVTPRHDCGGLADHAGEPGGAGGDGRAGPSIAVALAPIDTQLNGRVLLVRVTRAGGALDYYMVDTRGPVARFEVSAAGGAGGEGEWGTSGADGAKGADGADGLDGGECQDGGHGWDGEDGEAGGEGSDGGDGGDGGQGGTIVIEYAPGHSRLVDRVGFRVSGGAAGEGGEGGAGGSGGSGGEGGDGGNAGASRDRTGRKCSTENGQDGRGGASGPSGGQGDDGDDGRPGADGWVHARPVDASALWAREIAAGAAIAIESTDR